jgi:probable HAF family extracellular repeat protein
MQMKRTISTLLFVCFTHVLAIAQVYTITDLGPLTPTAINNLGEIVGNYNDQAYLWNFGHTQALGLLPGGDFSIPAAINDRGTVVGVADGTATLVSYYPGSPQTPHSFTCADVPQGFGWTSKQGIQGFGLMDIAGTNPDENPCLESGTSIVAYATGINNLNQTVGTIDWGSNTYVYAIGHNGVVWSDGMYVLSAPIVPHLLYSLTEANAINNRGQVVGAIGCCTTLGVGHALFWDSSDTVDLGTLGGPDETFQDYCSDAVGINDLGQIVGWSTTVTLPQSGGCGSAGEKAPHAFTWTKKQGMQDLGTLPGDTMSVARAINYSGEVIGTSGDSIEDTGFPHPGHDPYHNILSIAVVGRPFIWSPRRGMSDLNHLIAPHSRWVLTTASGINDWGQIVGEGTRNGEPHGYLLTPINPFRPY